MLTQESLPPGTASGRSSTSLPSQTCRRWLGRFFSPWHHDDGPSNMSDIAERLRVDSNFASQYRLRLIAAELIEPAGHGKVDFTMPYLRDYLRDHATLDSYREA